MRDSAAERDHSLGKLATPVGVRHHSVPGRAIPESGSLASLTGLRFLAALLVFGNHAGDAFLDTSSGLNGVLQTGSVGVSFFFILSGFVLTWASRPDDRPLAFYRRRAARIVANHVVAWAIALIVSTMIIGGSVGFLPALASLALVQAWHPSEEVHFAVNAVAWTLSVELFFYAVFPFVLPTLARLTPSRRLLAIGSAVAAAVVVAALAYALWPDGRHWIVYVFPLARLPEFVLGILLALEIRSGRTFHLSPTLMIAVAFVAWVACQAFPPAFQVASVTLVPFAVLIAAAATADIAGRHSLVRHRALVRLGEWSFAFYLLHALVLKVADHLIGLSGRGPVFITVAVPLLLALSIAAAGALFIFLERPLERRLRGAANRAPSRRPALPAP